MLDILAVQTALKAIVDAADVGLFAHVGAVDKPAPPCVIVPLPEVDYLDDFDRDMTATFTLRVLCGNRQDETSAQRVVARHMTPGPGSLIDALEDDQSVGGTAHTIAVVSASTARAYEYGDITYIGTDLTVAVTG